MAFAVEIYAGTNGHPVPDDDIVAAGAALRAQGRVIDFLGSVAIPGDEMTFWLFDASSRDVVDELLGRLGVVADRVVEAVASNLGERGGTT
jgi:hypothetical protein